MMTTSNGSLLVRRSILSIFVPIIFTLVTVNTSIAQRSNDEVVTYIDRLEKGEIDEAKKALPDLVARYQNSPALLYLQGRLASDGIEAVKFYQSILDNYPTNEWADDALYRIYQYYFALGLYRTAEAKMNQLKKDFPTSMYIRGNGSMKTPAKEEEQVQLPPTNIPITQDTPTETSKEVNTSTPPAVSNDPYTLQTGAFSTIQNAEKQRTFFEEKGYPVQITSKVRGGKSLHLVWVGNYANADDAKAAGNDIRSKFKIESIVVERH